MLMKAEAQLSNASRFKDSEFNMTTNIASLCELMTALDDLVVTLNTEWRLHRELFQVDDYSAFNESGPIVWSILRDALIDCVFMSASRLLDPPVSCGKENLSFERIIGTFPDGKEQDQVKKDYDHVKNVYGSALRHWRNRKLSHNDLMTIRGITALPNVSYAEVARLIDETTQLARSVGLVIRSIDQNYIPVVSYAPVIPNQHWAWRLTEVLKSGLEHLKGTA